MKFESFMHVNIFKFLSVPKIYSLYRITSIIAIIGGPYE